MNRKDAFRFIVAIHFPGFLVAQDLKIESLDPNPPAASLEFSILKLDQVTSLELDTATTLGEMAFRNDSSALLAWDPSRNRFTFTSSQQAGQRGFFRIRSTASDTAPDLDKDNLSDFLESVIGTSSSGLTAFDSDGDTFGDAFEINNHSNPLLDASIPELPVLSFTTPDSLANEGDGTLKISLTSNRAFSGNVRISVVDLSTTDDDDFIIVPQSVPLVIGSAGGTGTISILLKDDGELENSEALIIDLEPGSAYLPLGGTRHTVILADNDRYWSGTILSDVSQQPFRLCLICENGNLRGDFVSDSNAASSSVPEGSYPLSDVTMTDNSFSATAANLPTGSSQLFGAPASMRTLSFSSVPEVEPYGFSPDRIIGSVNDSGTGALPWSKDAEFILVRNLPVFDKPNIPYTLKE